MERLVVMMILSLACVAAGENHIVGGFSGWDLTSHLRNWSEATRIHVGDTLVFSYRVIHNVIEVNEAEFNTCSVGNPIATFHNGFTIIVLGKMGKRFFVCSHHCNEGLKMQVNVLPPKMPHSPRRKCPPPPPPPAPTAPCRHCSCGKQRIALIIVSVLLILLFIFSASIVVGFRIYSTTITTTTSASTTAPPPPLLAIDYPSHQDIQPPLSLRRAPEALALAEREVWI